MRRELAERRDAERRKIVLVGRISGHRRNPNSAATGRHIEISPARMWPCVLNSAGERDRRPLGQCGGAEIDLVVGQLSANARIEGAVVLGLRERCARGGKRACKHAGECASSDGHGYSSLSKACCRYLIPTGESAQANRDGYFGECRARLVTLELVQIGGDDFTRLFAADDWHDLKRRARPAPSKDPLLNQAEVVAFHELKTSSKIRFDPAVDVFEPVRQHPATFPEPLVCRQHVLVIETLDDHKKHWQDFFC